MDQQAKVLIGMAAAALAVVAAVAVYRRGRRKRALRVEASARKYLSDRYSALPKNVTVNCSDDALCPVLAAFDHPQTGARHRLEFGVREQNGSLSLISERTDNP